MEYVQSLMSQKNNEISQLKRTIDELSEENSHLRTNASSVEEQQQVKQIEEASEQSHEVDELAEQQIMQELSSNSHLIGYISNLKTKVKHLEATVLQHEQNSKIYEEMNAQQKALEATEV